MSTISGGSKPTFTVDQVLHAVEMNQLNQEWIVDSVPSASAGKNGDVVFVTTKGGVWAKVSGSWVQASLSSADMQTLQDQIDALGSSDDTKLDKGTTTYVDAKGIEDDISGIEQSISDLSDNYDQIVIDIGAAGQDLNVELASYLKKGTASYADAKGIEDDIDQEKTDRATADTALSEETAKKLDKGTTTYTDAREIQDAIEAISASGGYDDSWIQPALDGKSDEPHTHADLAAGDHNHDGDYATGDHTHASDDTKLDKGATTYLDAKAIEDDITANATAIANIQSSGYDDSELRGLIGDNTTAIAGKADDPHTHDYAAGDHNHNDDYADKSSTNIILNGMASDISSLETKTFNNQEAIKTKADDPHTHSEYQPTGDYATNTDLTNGLAGKADDPHTHAEYQAAGDYATNDALTTGLGGKSDTDHVHIQEGSGLTFDPSREGQIVQSTNGTDWVAGMSIRVVNAVPDDTEGEIGDVVFVVGS